MPDKKQNNLPKDLVAKLTSGESFSFSDLAPHMPSSGRGRVGKPNKLFEAKTGEAITFNEDDLDHDGKLSDDEFKEKMNKLIASKVLSLRNYYKARRYDTTAKSLKTKKAIFVDLRIGVCAIEVWDKNPNGSM